MTLSGTNKLSIVGQDELLLLLLLSSSLIGIFRVVASSAPPQTQTQGGRADSQQMVNSGNVLGQMRVESESDDVRVRVVVVVSKMSSSEVGSSTTEEEEESELDSGDDRSWSESMMFRMLSASDLDLRNRLRI